MAFAESDWLPRRGQPESLFRKVDGKWFTFHVIKWTGSYEFVIDHVRESTPKEAEDAEKMLPEDPIDVQLGEGRSGAGATLPDEEDASG